MQLQSNETEVKYKSDATIIIRQDPDADDYPFTFFLVYTDDYETDAVDLKASTFDEAVIEAKRIADTMERE